MKVSFAPELLRCPACESHNLTDSRYCNQCGIRLLRESMSDAPRSLGPLSVDPQARTEPPPQADPLLGVIVAERYRILEPLGRGGMGVVYKVEHARIGKLMALKLLTGELTRDQSLLARFKREALMASRLSHPNTVQVFDFGVCGGLTYLAMEYLRGEDLGRLIRRSRTLSATRTAKIVVQICSSLAEAHGKGIVHRDLKPENIIVLRSQNGDDVAKVLDFGLAKLRESPELSEVTSRGAIVGTPYYMSPEQIRGEPTEPRSDVYSLGALTYTCLTGRPVFEATTPMAILARHLTEQPQDPSRRFPELGIPSSVGAIVLKALAKDPEQRYQSVRELQKALVDELRGQGQVSVEEMIDTQQVHCLSLVGEEVATRGEVERYERKLRRHGQAAWATLAIVAGVATFAGFRAVQESRVEPGFNGFEAEPNDAAKLARAVPFGESVRGQLGQRIDVERSDRDFYRIEVPAGVRAVRLENSGVPNIATCTLLYRGQSEEPLGRYCTGTAGQELAIPALAIEPGSYLVGVMQDREQYTDAAPPPVLENVSDNYRLRVSPAQAASEQELEPNDDARAASSIKPNTVLRGRLSFMRDVDVVCADAGGRSVSFVIEDAKGSSVRPRQAVLEVTPIGGERDGVPIRVHGGAVAPSPYDVASPWASPVVALGPATPRACLVLRLVPNPLAPTPHPRVAPASSHEYQVLVRPL